MDEIKEQINNLIDNNVNNNSISKELFLYKIIIIKSILKANTFLGFSHSQRQINRIKRIKSKRNNYKSKFNNLVKLLLKSFE